MESRKDDPSAVMPEASERLLTQSTRVLRLARELALSADASTIARLVARHVGELSGGGPTAVCLLDPDGIPVHAAAAGFAARQPLGPPRLVVRALAEARLVSAAGDELPELDAYGASCREAFSAPIAAGGDVFGALLVGVPSGGQVGLHPSLLVTLPALAGTSVRHAPPRPDTQAHA